MPVVVPAAELGWIPCGLRKHGLGLDLRLLTALQRKGHSLQRARSHRTGSRLPPRPPLRPGRRGESPPRKGTFRIASPGADSARWPGSARCALVRPHHAALLDRQDRRTGLRSPSAVKRTRYRSGRIGRGTWFALFLQRCWRPGLSKARRTACTRPGVETDSLDRLDYKRRMSTA